MLQHFEWGVQGALEWFLRSLPVGVILALVISGALDVPAEMAK